MQTPAKRSRESPTSSQNPLKSAKMDTGNDISDQNNQLLAAIKKMLDNEFEDKIQKAVKKSFTEELDMRLQNVASKDDITDLRETIEKQKEENDVMKQKLMNFEGQLERLDKKDRASKLIFTNVDCSNGALAAAYQVCNECMKIDSQLIVVKSAFVMKRADQRNSKILVEFENRNMVSIIFKHVKNLNGSRIGVERDLTQEQQKIRKMLMDLKNVLLEISKGMKVFVSDVSMKIGSNKFSFKGGRLEASLPNLDVNQFFTDNYNINIDEYLQNRN